MDPVLDHEDAQKHPHKMMKDWPESGSQTRVAHMTAGDFYGSETSATLDAPTEVRIEFVGTDGSDYLVALASAEAVSLLPPLLLARVRV